MFWRMQSLTSRLNHYLRLFDKSRGHISDMPIHAAPKVDGETGRLKACFMHYGETSIHSKVDRINHYSSGLVEDKVRKNPRWLRTRMVIYPGFAFLKSYLFKRNFLNGWAGFIASVCMSHYAFLKYAKLYEHYQTERLE